MPSNNINTRPYNKTTDDLKAIRPNPTTGYDEEVTLDIQDVLDNHTATTIEATAPSTPATENLLVNVKDLEAKIAAIPSGVTDLTYTPSATKGTVVSSTGLDADIPLATTVDAGLLAPAEKVFINSNHSKFVAATGIIEDTNPDGSKTSAVANWGLNPNFSTNDSNFRVYVADGNNNQNGTMEIPAVKSMLGITAPQNSLLPASSTLAPTVDAVNTGLATKISGVKVDGVTLVPDALGYVNVTDNDVTGISDSSSVDLTLTGTVVAGVIKTAKSVTTNGDTTPVELVNDSAAPGNNKFYGTSATGVKGFQSLPASATADQISIQGDGVATPFNTVFADVNVTNDGTNTTKSINTQELKNQIQTNQYKRGLATLVGQSGNVDSNGTQLTDIYIATLDYPITTLEANQEFVLRFDADSQTIEDPNNPGSFYSQYIDLGTGAKPFLIETRDSGTPFRDIKLNDIRKLSVHTVIYNIDRDIFQLVDPAEALPSDLSGKQDKISVATHSIVAGGFATTQKIRLSDQGVNSDINVDDLFSLPTTKNAQGKIVLGKSLLVLSAVQPTPTPTGNTTNLNSTFKDANGDTWIVDGTGIAIKAGGTDEIVTVTVTTMPTLPTTTIAGATFVPNTPALTTATYEITDGVTVVYAKWNGTQYISAPAPIQHGVRYGTATPTTITGVDKKGDEYIQNSTGAFGGTYIANWIYNGTAWDRVGNAGGNIIAFASNVGPTFNLDFDGYRVTVPANGEMRIATISGTKSVSWLAEQEYPGGSFSNSNGTNAAPITLTTTSVQVADNVTVASERVIVLLQDYTTNAVYRITTQRLGAITANWTGFVEKIGITTNQILTANNGLTITNGVITQNLKQYALYTRNAVLATGANVNIPWTNAVIPNIGTEITQSGANITITPFSGVTRSYKIRFNAKYTFNAILAHISDFRLRNPLATAQTINGVSIPAAGYFGEGTSLFSTTNGSQEAGNGILEYVITTSSPVTFSASVVATSNTPTLGSSSSNRYPTIEIESIN